MINLIHGDCFEEMKKIEDGSVDLVLTSPPYDNLRSYDDFASSFFKHNSQGYFLWTSLKH